MLFTNIPTELILEIINKLEYFDILELFKTCIIFRDVINSNTINIFKKFTNKRINKLNFQEYSKLYLKNIIKKKEALIILIYIHKWLTRETHDSIMERVIINRSMTEATIKCLKLLCETKEKEIDIKTMKNYERINNNNIVYVKKINNLYYISHIHLKKLIEKFISEDILNSINTNRIIIEGFSFNEKYNFDNPNIYIYNKDYTNISKYFTKVNKHDLGILM